MTDTKRLRELHAQYFNGPPGARVTVAEGAELRSLILAACEELEVGRTERDEFEKTRDEVDRFGFDCSRVDTPMDLVNELFRQAKESAEDEDARESESRETILGLRAENEKLRERSPSEWRPMRDTLNALIVDSTYIVADEKSGWNAFNTLAQWTEFGTFWCPEINDVLAEPSHVLCVGSVPVVIPATEPDTVIDEAMK